MLEDDDSNVNQYGGRGDDRDDGSFDFVEREEWRIGVSVVVLVFFAVDVVVDRRDARDKRCRVGKPGKKNDQDGTRGVGEQGNVGGGVVFVVISVVVVDDDGSRKDAHGSSRVGGERGYASGGVAAVVLVAVVVIVDCGDDRDGSCGVGE